MTAAVRRWVAGREPTAPDALAERVASALGGGGHADDDAVAEPSAVVDACLRAAEATLTRVLGDGGSERAAALDLLAADALVTYAFEAASEMPEAIPELARTAMARLSHVDGV